MPLSKHKTKIIATIGPASESPEMLERLIRAGMNIARLNFSHGDFAGHAAHIANIRAAAKAAGRRVAIMADLPGPKMRVGKIDPEPVQLVPGEPFTLTADDIVGDARRVSVSFDTLPRVVKPGDRLFLNDGLIQLLAETAHCQGQPRRQAGHHRHPDARIHGHQPAAHPRRSHRCRQCHSRWHRLHHALRRIRDGQVPRGSRGDARQNRRLHRGPPPARPLGGMKAMSHPPATATEAIAAVVEHALDTVPCAAVFVPTKSGATARMIARFNPAVWNIALSRDDAVCQGLAFSYGVHPVQLADDPDNWREFAADWLREYQLPGAVAMLVAGPSPRNPAANHRLEFLRIGDIPPSET